MGMAVAQCLELGGMGCHLHLVLTDSPEAATSLSVCPCPMCVWFTASS